MRRLFAIVVCSLLMVACNLTTTYELPDRTVCAKSQLSDLQLALSSTTHIVDLMLCVDEWITQSDEDAKYDLEILYFDNHKIRLSEEVVTLSSGKLDEVITIQTAGSSFRAKGTIWTLECDGESLTVECTDDDAWSVVVSEKPAIMMRECTLDYHLIKSNKGSYRYDIKGSGKATTQRRDLDEPAGFDFTIEDALSVISTPNCSYIKGSKEMLFGSGEILFSTWEDGKEYSSRVIFAESSYKISYRGFEGDSGNAWWFE